MADPGGAAGAVDLGGAAAAAAAATSLVNGAANGEVFARLEMKNKLIHYWMGDERAAEYEHFFREITGLISVTITKNLVSPNKWIYTATAKVSLNKFDTTAKHLVMDNIKVTICSANDKPGVNMPHSSSPESRPDITHVRHSLERSTERLIQVDPSASVLLNADPSANLGVNTTFQWKTSSITKVEYDMAPDELSVYHFAGRWSMDALGPNVVDVNGTSFEMRLKNIGLANNNVRPYTQEGGSCGRADQLPLWCRDGYHNIPFTNSWAWNSEETPTLFIAVETSGKNVHNHSHMFHCRYLYSVNCATGQEHLLDKRLRVKTDQYHSHMRFKTNTWRIPMDYEDKQFRAYRANMVVSEAEKKEKNAKLKAATAQQMYESISQSLFEAEEKAECAEKNASLKRDDLIRVEAVRPIDGSNRRKIRETRRLADQATLEAERYKRFVTEWKMDQIKADTKKNKADATLEKLEHEAIAARLARECIIRDIAREDLDI